MYIYKITNTVNNKIYIGLCTKKSCKSLNYLGSGKILKQAIKKYGKINFIKEILEESETFNYKDLQALEKKYIKEFNSTNPEIGYNISLGGDCNAGEANGMYNKTHTAKSIKKIKETKELRKKENPDYGKLSEENRLRLSKRMTIRNKLHPTLPNGHSEDTKIRIGKIMREKYKNGEVNLNRPSFSEERKKQYSIKFSGVNNPFYNKKHTEETKEKIRNIRILKQPPCLKVDKDGNILKRYDHLTNVRKDGYRPDLVKRVDEGLNTLHKGYKWIILWDNK